ncbi:MAG: DUF2007 domain-containing protein [Ignavibacteriales bacterium]|jgi:hypothetical protein|nr:DUF2007 domain-containing protein [Ignavibacteriales bacterium]
MPVCPNCEYEYVEGITFCPDCGTALLDDEKYIKPEEWSEQNWEIVYTSSQEYEVEMIKNNLESAGIKAVVLSQKDRNYPAPGDFSVVKLLVRKEDKQDAVAFIQKVKNENVEEDSNGDE